MRAVPVPAIAGAWLFEPTPQVDRRGFFSRTFDRDVMRSAGIDPDAFAQDSMSRSRKGVVRGMHLRSGSWPLPITLTSTRDREAASLAAAMGSLP